jgi:hypothetical protein
MAAGVVARELGLDFYTIDLSAVVRRYIGETGKNLDRGFRYSNVEVAYLFQKMKDHDGMVILTSNLSRNIDLTFARIADVSGGHRLRAR